MSHRPDWRGEIIATIALAGPIMGAQLCIMGSNFAANLIVGRLGETPLAALSIGGTLFAIVYTATIGIMAGLSPLISEAFGAGNDLRVGLLWRQGIAVVLTCALGAIVIFSLATPILSVLGQAPDASRAAGWYLAGIAIGVPLQFLFVATRNLTEGTSDSKPSLVLAAIGLAAAIMLIQWLALDGTGQLGLGVFGAGLGLASSNGLMGALLVVYVMARSKYRRFALLARPWIDLSTIRHIVHLGIPLAAGIVGEMLFFAGATLIIGTMGQRQVASHQIALNAAAMMYMVPLGLSMAVAVRVGQRRGARDPQGAKRAGWITFSLALIFAIVSTTLFLIFPERVAALYTNDPELRASACVLLRWAGIFQIADGLQSVGLGALRGLQDVRAPFRNTLISYWVVGTPVGLTAAYPLGYGTVGIWMGLLTGLVVASVLHWTRFHRMTRLAS